MSEVREAPFTLRFSAYRMMAEFNNPGEFIQLIDFRNEIESYLPSGSTLIGANIELMKFQCTHYLPSLYRAKAWSRADPDTDNPADLIAVESEWQRVHSVAGGYAVQISVAETDPSDGEWHVLSFKNLYNTGLENYVNLLNPLLTLGDRDYFDLRSKLGFRIAEIPSQIEFGGRDRIAINGAANIYALYEYSGFQPTLYDESRHREINSTAWTLVLNDRPHRAALYLSNLGEQPVHFLFTNNIPSNSLSIESYPAIAPGESLSYENSKLFGNDKIPAVYNLVANQNLYCRTQFGSTQVGCQSFYYN